MKERPSGLFFDMSNLELMAYSLIQNLPAATVRRPDLRILLEERIVLSIVLSEVPTASAIPCLDILGFSSMRRRRASSRMSLLMAVEEA